MQLNQLVEASNNNNNNKTMTIKSKTKQKKKVKLSTRNQLHAAVVFKEELNEWKLARALNVYWCGTDLIIRENFFFLFF